MTAPAPTAEDVLETAAINATCNLPSGDGLTQDDVFSWIEDCLTAAVVAAVRSMTVEQQAQLLGGEVQRSGRTHLGASGLFEHEPVARLVGPWRAEP